MSKAEWGVKRNCAACGDRFYDMQRSPIHCPKCGAAFLVPAERERHGGAGTGRANARGARRADAASARDAQRFYWSTEIRPVAAEDEETEAETETEEETEREPEADDEGGREQPEEADAAVDKP